MVATHESDPRLRLREHELRGAAAHDVERGRVRARIGEPARHLALLGTTVEVRPRKEVRSMAIWVQGDGRPANGVRGF